MRFPKNRIRCVISLLCALLLLIAGAITAGAITVGAVDSEQYDTEYDEDIGKVTIHVHGGYMNEDTIDLRAPMLEAAEKNASVQINVGNVRLYLNASAVKQSSMTEGPLYIHAKQIQEEKPKETASDTEAETETETVPVKEVRYKITFGNFDFEYGSLRIRIRYVPENAELISVLSRMPDGEERTLTFGYADKYVSFYPETLNGEQELVIAERIPVEAPARLPLLLAGTLGALLLASAVLAVLLMTKQGKRLFQGDASDRA